VEPPREETAAALKQRALSSFNWKSLSVAMQNLLIFTVSVVLARLISPQTFGLFGMAAIFTGFALHIATLGMEPAIAQRRNLTEGHLRSGMTLSVLMGLTITAALWLLAGPVAVFFHEPRVAPVLRVLSLIFVFSGLSSTSMGLLRRRLEFDLIFKAELTAYLVGYTAVSITLAALGHGLLGLVAGTLVTHAILCCLVLYFARPPLGFGWSWEDARELIGFGGGVSLTRLFGAAATRVDNIAIGRFLTAADLGLYARAYNIMFLPLIRFTGIFSSVLLPVYAKMQDDRPRIADGYLKVLGASTLFVFPLMVGLMLSARYVVVGVYGPKWEGATLALRVLCAAGVFKIGSSMAASVVQASGRVYLQVWREGASLALLTAGALAMVRYGLGGVGLAVVLASFYLYAAMSRQALSLLGLTWRAFYLAQRPSLVIALIVGLAQAVMILVLERTVGEGWMLLKLFLLLGASATVFLFSLLYLPASIKGEVPAWIARNYAPRLPRPLRGFILGRF
jgi:PST family polysaccharide transporter